MGRLERSAVMAVGAGLLAAAVGGCAGRPSGQGPAEVVPPGSLEGLGRAVMGRLRAGDCAAVQGLMAPPELGERAGLLRGDDAERYRAYYRGIPELARRYRAYLEQRGLFRARTTDLRCDAGRELRSPTGQAVAYSTGILVLFGAEGVELVDQAVRIDGRWYIIRLATEADEARLHGD